MTVTVTTSSRHATVNAALSESRSFDLTFKNPCIDQEFVYIEAPALADIEYTIHADAAAQPPHAPFTVVTKPAAHDLCGDLRIVAKFDYAPVDGDPLSYDEPTRVFTVYSLDWSLYLAGTVPFSVEAEFIAWPLATYPTVSTAMASADVLFGDPCLVPRVFDATAQNDPSPDSFSGDDIVFELVKFTISPFRCRVEYACTSVERVDGDPSSITCDDFSFDGIYDGQKSDGKLTFRATTEDYLGGVFDRGQYTVTITGTAT